MMIAVINLKGGSAKTTTAMALAEAASRDGLDVTVLDADPQGDATSWADGAETDGTPLPYQVGNVNAAGLRRIARRGSDGLLIVDCPPAGSVVDVAADAADLVVVPATQGPFELEHAVETAHSLDRVGKPYAILLTKVSRTTLARDAVERLRGEDLSVLDATVPATVRLQKVIGHAWPSNLQGYEEAWRELRGAVESWR